MLSNPLIDGLAGINFGLTFHHLGLAVKRPEAAVAFLRGMGYVTAAPVFDPLQNVNLILCTHTEAPSVEVIYRGNGHGPLDTLVARHANGIVYHCCYASADVDKTLRKLSDVGIRTVCVSPPKPAVLFGGASVSFYQFAGVGLIEIVQEMVTTPEDTDAVWRP